MPGRIGLVGYATDDPVGRLTRLLWDTLPFDSWLVPRHPSLGLGEPPGGSAGRSVVCLTGCAQTAKKFLSGLATVVAVQRCWPQELFYYCHCFYGQETVLVAHPDQDHHRSSYWLRYATRVLVPYKETADKLRSLGFQPIVCPVPWSPKVLSLGVAQASLGQTGRLGTWPDLLWPAITGESNRGLQTAV